MNKTIAHLQKYNNSIKIVYIYIYIHKIIRTDKIKNIGGWELDKTSGCVIYCFLPIATHILTQVALRIALNVSAEFLPSYSRQSDLHLSSFFIFRPFIPPVSSPPSPLRNHRSPIKAHTQHAPRISASSREFRGNEGTRTIKVRVNFQMHFRGKKRKG